MPLLLMGLGLPFFFVPLTALGLGCLDESETASTAGVLNFIRTLSGAVGASIVTTAWENDSIYMHAELSGLVDRKCVIASIERDCTDSNRRNREGMPPSMVEQSSGEGFRSP